MILEIVKNSTIRIMVMDSPYFFIVNGDKSKIIETISRTTSIQDFFKIIDKLEQNKEIYRYTPDTISLNLDCERQL